MYILPPSLINMVESNDVIAGSIGLDFLPDELMMALYFFSIGVGITILFLLVASYLNKRDKLRSGKMMMIAAIAILIIILGVFLVGISTLSKLGVGSFLGSGSIDVTIPGEISSVSTDAVWGPSVGFVFCVISLVLIMYLYMRDFSKGVQG
jgi:hypothetical protein